MLAEWYVNTTEGQDWLDKYRGNEFFSTQDDYKAEVIGFAEEGVNLRDLPRLVAADARGLGVKVDMAKIRSAVTWAVSHRYIVPAAWNSRAEVSEFGNTMQDSGLIRDDAYLMPDYDHDRFEKDLRQEHIL